MSAESLKPCPAFGGRAAEPKKSELPSRFPYYVQCKVCAFMTDFVKLPGIAVKLWNEAKIKGNAMAKA